MGEDAFHLACADHPRLIDGEDIARAEQIAPLRPAMFEARDGARRDARAVLQTFGGDARERCTAHTEPRFFPRLARPPQHRALAAPGVSDAHPNIPSARPATDHRPELTSAGEGNKGS